MCRIDVTTYLKCSHQCGFILFTHSCLGMNSYTQKIKYAKHAILKPSIIYTLIVTLIQERVDIGYL